MRKSGHFLEHNDIGAFFVPIDMQGASGGHITSDWLRMRGHHVTIVLFKNNGTASDDPTITILQASDAAGTGSKALNFTTIYRKEEVAANLLTTGTWTKTTQAAANTYTNLTSAESSLFWVIDIDGSDFDADGGFYFIKATVADVGGNAQLGCCFAIFSDLHYSAPAANNLSLIA